MQIVCYAGGSCGDLITALIDSRGCELAQGRVRVCQERSQLKKPHQFADHDQKDIYLQQMTQCYHSLPSHDLDYHATRHHDFIGIVVSPNTASWAAERFKRMHADHVWQEMMHHCGADSLDQYAQVLLDFSSVVVTKTSRIIDLNDIINGTVIDVLESLIAGPVDVDLYRRWRQHQ